VICFQKCCKVAVGITRSNRCLYLLAGQECIRITPATNVPTVSNKVARDLSTTHCPASKWWIGYWATPPSASHATPDWVFRECLRAWRGSGDCFSPVPVRNGNPWGHSLKLAFKLEEQLPVPWQKVAPPVGLQLIRAVVSDKPSQHAASPHGVERPCVPVPVRLGQVHDLPASRAESFACVRRLPYSGLLRGLGRQSACQDGWQRQQHRQGGECQEYEPHGRHPSSCASECRACRS
jgi:hypothetical protein